MSVTDFFCPFKISQHILDYPILHETFLVARNLLAFLLRNLKLVQHSLFISVTEKQIYPRRLSPWALKEIGWLVYS